MVTPLGNVSVNVMPLWAVAPVGAVRVNVSVDVPPGVTEVGLNALVRLGFAVLV